MPEASVEFAVGLGSSITSTLSVHYTVTPLSAAGHARCPEPARDTLLGGRGSLPVGAAPGSRVGSGAQQGEWDIDSATPAHGSACGFVSSLSPRLTHANRNERNDSTALILLEAAATLRLRAVGSFVVRAIAVADDRLPSEVAVAVVRVDPPLMPLGVPVPRSVGALPTGLPAATAASGGISA